MLNRLLTYLRNIGRGFPSNNSCLAITTNVVKVNTYFFGW